MVMLFALDSILLESLTDLPQLLHLLNLLISFWNPLYEHWLLPCSIYNFTFTSFIASYHLGIPLFIFFSYLFILVLFISFSCLLHSFLQIFIDPLTFFVISLLLQLFFPLFLHLLPSSFYLLRKFSSWLGKNINIWSR